MSLTQNIVPASTISEDFLVRPVTLADAQAAAELFNRYSRWQTGADQTTEAELRNEWQEPGYNLQDSTLSVWTKDGRMIGYIEFYDRGEPHVIYNSWCVVHPDFQGKGLGGMLLDWLIRRAQASVPLAPQQARVVLQQTLLSSNPGAASLLAARGFQHVRNFYRMVTDLDRPPALPVVSEGITIRSLKPEEERQGIHAIHESFMDHWGFTREPFDQFYARWSHHMHNHPQYDPSLFFAAFDGAEIAGVSLCYKSINEDPDMGWVGTLGVRRPWRKRGLGTALLLHSFGAFYQLGKPRAGLSVDASSLTGALRLYEKAGMHPEKTYLTYLLELRAGEDYQTKSVSGY